MNTTGTLLVTGLLILLMLSSPVLAATVTGLGFVTYAVTVDSPTGNHSAVVNETVGTSDKAGFSDVILQIIGQVQNLTYSRLVNSSIPLFPYLPAIPSQSFSYSNGTMLQVHLNVTSGGSQQITFHGVNYTLSVFAFSASGTFGNRTFSGTGSVSVFPSTLVYSVDVSPAGGNYGYHSVLKATDLQLSVPQTQSSTVAIVSVGAGVGVVALVGALLLRRGNHAGTARKEKPIHWVD